MTDFYGLISDMLERRPSASYETEVEEYGRPQASKNDFEMLLHMGNGSANCLKAWCKLA